MSAHAPSSHGRTAPRSSAPRGPGAGARSLLLLPALVGALVALAPIAYLVVRATETGLDAVWEELSRPQTRTMLRRSVVITLTVTVLCVLVGTAAAWLVATTDLLGRRFLEVALALPLAVPTYVAAYTWLATVRDPDPFFGS